MTATALHRATPKARKSASFPAYITDELRRYDEHLRDVRGLAETTHHYVEADLTMKERALAKLHEPDVKIQRYRAPDSLLDLLKTL
jgi:hypothetical protein